MVEVNVCSKPGGLNVGKRRKTIYAPTKKPVRRLMPLPANHATSMLSEPTLTSQVHVVFRNFPLSCPLLHEWMQQLTPSCVCVCVCVCVLSAFERGRETEPHGTVSFFCVVWALDVPCVSASASMRACMSMGYVRMFPIDREGLSVQRAERD